MKQPLQGKVAVVGGATRGTGRGIACELGAAGAIVYCTGRSTRENRKAVRDKKANPFDLSNRPETIDETAEMVTARGGQGIAVQVDHTIPEQVQSLFQRVEQEQGKLDILVNDVWGGDELTEWKPFWESSLEKGLLMIERAVHSHIITAHYATPLMIKNKRGLIVEITDGNHYGYRGMFYYDLVKTSVIRLAFMLATELKKYKISAVALTPGFIRSEAMLDYFGVTEANWQDAVKKRPDFGESETPFYTGRAVVALATDRKIVKKSGRVFAAWDLGPEYGFTDVDGRQPNMKQWLMENMPHWQWKTCDETFYEYWGLK
ncbi:MAG: SDR family NAD(P)-dependent oxidoreductase [Acidobacteria bacterium]|nr:SDR family NAD(P)-dependent oxidoreductase [Acidobacteriota bacterium]